MPDLQAARAFYENFSLDVRDENGELGLYTFGETHRWGLLTQGERKRLAHLSFGVFEDDLPRFREQLARHAVGLLPGPDSRGGNSIWFEDLYGNHVELRVAEKSSGNAKTEFAMPSSPAGVAGAVLRRRVQTVRSRRMSHVAIFYPKCR